MEVGAICEVHIDIMAIAPKKLYITTYSNLLGPLVTFADVKWSYVASWGSLKPTKMPQKLANGWAKGQEEGHFYFLNINSLFYFILIIHNKSYLLACRPQWHNL